MFLIANNQFQNVFNQKKYLMSVEGGKENERKII